MAKALEEQRLADNAEVKEYKAQLASAMQVSQHHGRRSVAGYIFCNVIR